MAGYTPANFMLSVTIIDTSGPSYNQEPWEGAQVPPPSVFMVIVHRGGSGPQGQEDWALTCDVCLVVFPLAY
jgi:hypothetical protein